MKRSITYAACAMVCLIAMPAHAYVDPGTGSMAIQIIIGGIVAAAFMIKTYYYGIKRWIARLFERDGGYEVEEDSEGANSHAVDESSDTAK